MWKMKIYGWRKAILMIHLINLSKRSFQFSQFGQCCFSCQTSRKRYSPIKSVKHCCKVIFLKNTLHFLVKRPNIVNCQSNYLLNWQENAFASQITCQTFWGYSPSGWKILSPEHCVICLAEAPKSLGICEHHHRIPVFSICIMRYPAFT